MRSIETDYLVVGAGAMGMAFADALIDHADVHVTLVDRRHAAGGHWLDAYPFVQLHQASVFYGVASTVLGSGAVQVVGPEAGLQERARQSEIQAYYDDILRRRFLGSGRMDLAAMRAAGVAVALGSDIGAGPDVSMVRVARAMAETAVALGHMPPSPAECFWQITRGNADALGWADAGRLEPGAAADLLVIEPDIDWRSAPDPLGALLFAWDDRWIKAVIAEGRLVYGSLAD